MEHNQVYSNNLVYKHPYPALIIDTPTVPLLSLDGSIEAYLLVPWGVPWPYWGTVSVLSVDMLMMRWCIEINMEELQYDQQYASNFTENRSCMVQESKEMLMTRRLCLGPI